MIRRPHVPRTRYQVFIQQQFAADTPIALLCEKGDAVRIEPRPPSPSTCRLCARSSRTLLRPQASGDGTRMQSVLGESRASCRPSSWAGSNSVRLTATAVRGARRQLLTMAHIHRIVRPRCRSESSWLTVERVWACTRPLQSVHAAAELVCRRRIVVSCVCQE